MRSWIDEIVDSTVEAESPERFQYWASVAALSAVVKKNVYLDKFYYKLYPNIYVMLVGKSGVRKGNPVTLAKKLVAEAESSRIIQGRGSIQAIIQEMGKAHSVNGGGVMKDANAFIVSGELDALFVKDPEAMTILTDLYDTHAHEPEWKNTLKSGKDILKNPCITLLGGTNEEHFRSAVAEKDVKGGFIARTLIVLESKRRTINDLMDPPKRVPDVECLSKYLKELAKIEGKFTVDPEAKAIYREWYKQLAMMNHEDNTGTVERIGDTVLKVSMLVSLAYDFDLVIRPEHVQEGIDKCIECLSGTKQVTMGAGKSEFAEPTALVLKELLDRPNNEVTRKQLLSKYWGTFDSIILDRVMETITQTGAVTATQVRGKADITYRMDKKAVEAYKRFKKEVN